MTRHCPLVFIDTNHQMISEMLLNACGLFSQALGASDGNTTDLYVPCSILSSDILVLMFNCK